MFTVMNVLVVGAAVVAGLVIYLIVRQTRAWRRRRWNKRRAINLYEALEASVAGEKPSTKRKSTEQEELDRLLQEVIEAKRSQAKRERLAELSRQEDLERQAIASIQSVAPMATTQKKVSRPQVSIEEEVRMRIEGTWKEDA